MVCEDKQWPKIITEWVTTWSQLFVGYYSDDEMPAKEDEMDRACSTHWLDEKCVQNYRSETWWKIRIGMHSASVWILIKWILKKSGLRISVGFIWLRIESGGGLLWTRKWTSCFLKWMGIYWLNERPLASQKGLCSKTESVFYISLVKVRFCCSYYNVTLACSLNWYENVTVWDRHWIVFTYIYVLKWKNMTPHFLYCLQQFRCMVIVLCIILHTNSGRQTYEISCSYPRWDFIRASGSALCFIKLIIFITKKSSASWILWDAASIYS